MQRMISVLAVAALMAALLAASAMPAFADPGGSRGHYGSLPNGGTLTAYGSGNGNGTGGGGGGGNSITDDSGLRYSGGSGSKNHQDGGGHCAFYGANGPPQGCVGKGR